ncbi:unnamed protein product [Debaryomyces fabryi]|nr:unnamed protein product [Debaryomyces fabryi]
MQNINILNWILLLLTDVHEIYQIQHFFYPRILNDKIKICQNNDANSQNQIFRLLMKGIRNGTRSFIFFFSIGNLARKILKHLSNSRMSKSFKILHLAISEYDVVQFSKFISLLISSKPFIKAIVLKSFKTFKTDSLSEKEKLVGSSLASIISCVVSVYFYYPKAFLLHTVSWFYFVFGVDYGYRLFEHKQLKKIEYNEVQGVSVNDLQRKSILVKSFNHLRNKSWLIFPLAVSYTWKEYIMYPENVHDLVHKYFGFINNSLSGTFIEGDMLSLLRCSSTSNVRIKLNFKTLFTRNLPQIYSEVLKYAFPLMVAKHLKQNINIYNNTCEKHKFNILHMLKTALKESVKFTTFFTAVPTLLFILTSFFSQYKSTHGYKLRVIGFIGGLFAFLYRRGKCNRFRGSSENTALTNREFWLTIFRETVIASTSVAYMKGQTKKNKGFRNMENIDRVAFIIGLSTIICIQDYLSKYSEIMEYIFKDAKFLSRLNNIVESSSLFLFN